MPPSSVSPRPPATTGLDVRPFRALTYRRRDPGHLARVSSPAYDLVTATGRDRLADTDPHNIVRLILPRVDPAAEDSTVRPGTAGTVTPAPLSSAEQAGRTLQAWLADGVLERDEAPGLWLYELRSSGGAPPTVGWLGAVALPPPGSTAVLPHEDTYPPAVEGRRALLSATGTDLEPIVLAHDPDPTITELTRTARQGVPTLQLDDGDGVLHRLWRVTDPSLLDQLTAVWGRTRAVIADGHHRFAAAQAHHRSAPGPGSDAVLALVTPMGPGGLRVEAIHRVIPDLGMDQALAAVAGGFRSQELQADVARQSVADVAGRWIGAAEGSGFLLTDGRRLVHLTDPTEGMLATVPREAPSAWRGLDVVLAHYGLIEHAWHRREDPEAVLIAHDVAEALRLADERSGLAVLLRAPSPADVAAVARAGVRMPRKSTLFVPKPRTGLVLRPLTG